MKHLFIAALLASAWTSSSSVVSAAPPPPASCGDGVPNPFPIYTAEPVFVKQVQNAKLYTAGTGNDTFQVLHLWGTPYQKGFAQGQLLSEQVANTTSAIATYIEEKIEYYVPFIPKEWINILVEYGALPLLTLTYEVTLPFMKKDFVEEMDGIAAGSGVDVTYVRMLNMFPELTRAACSIVGANGPATPNRFINQLRALDIGPDIPIKNQAQVTIYHSEDPSTSNTFLTVGWTGMVGALTGFSANGVGIGEKVWYSAPESVFATQGEPWMFVLRNVLEKTNTMAESLDLIQNSKRTCAIHVGLGTSSDNSFRGLQIAAKAFEVFNDSSINYADHPATPGVVYWDKHVQPTKNSCLADLIRAHYGNLTAEVLALQVAPIAKTGDFHTVTFDYKQQFAYIANSRKTFVTDGNDNAYMRQFTRIDMAKLFNEPKP